jgi:hypothetical protein
MAPQPKMHVLLPRFQYIRFWCRPQYSFGTTSVGIRLFLSHKAYIRLLTTLEPRVAIKKLNMCKVCCAQVHQWLYEHVPQFWFEYLDGKV